MRAGGRRTRRAAALAAAISLATLPALADVTKDQCLQANVAAQDLRRDGKLSAARDQLRTCGAPSCPALVRDDCVKRLDDLERAQPTIIFGAKDASGADVIDVHVSMDGQPLVDHLDGKPVNVDSGAHSFTFEVSGQPPLTEKLVVMEGEKERRERVVLGTGGSVVAPSAAPQASSAGVPPPRGEGIGTQKILGLAAGGLGVAGVAVGAVFGVMTFSEKSQQQSDCASPCSTTSHAQAINDHSSAMTDGTISTVGFIAGGALLVGGAVLFFTAGRPSERSGASGMVMMPSVGPGGGGMLLKGAF